MAGDIFFSHDHGLCWTGSVGLVTEWAWFLLNHNYERKLPIDYVNNLAFAQYNSIISFRRFHICETELLSIEDFYKGMKLFREWENQRLCEGKPSRICGSCPECLDKPLAMAEIRLEQLRQEKENGTWTPTEDAIKFKKRGHSRPMISSDSISLREGLVWKSNSVLANKAIGRILNNDLDALLPLLTTYELVTDRKEVRFHIHKDFDAELDSVSYAHNALKEWHDSESKQLTTLTNEEHPQIGQLIAMFERRLKELNEGNWEPFEGEHSLGHDLCGSGVNMFDDMNGCFNCNT